MKRWVITGVVLLSLVLSGSVGCGQLGGGDEADQTYVEVERGDLTLSVSGSGNIEVVTEQKLSFGVGGRIELIFVEEGDRVTEGDVLARLDTDALELALTQAEVTLTQAEVALELAKYERDQVEDVAEAKDDVEDAEYELQIAEAGLKRAFLEGDQYIINYWQNEVVVAQLNLAEAKQDLAELLAEPEYAGVTIDEAKIKVLQVKAAEENVKQAEESLEYTQNQLDDAVITAPFDGVVASVDAEEGDIITSPTYGAQTIIHLVDLTTMELNAEVDEIDIAVVQPGQKAVIEVDALPDVLFEGVVTLISPLPEVQAGVVLYDVKINFSVPEDSMLRIGMSATVDIIIDERSNVLIVPDRAIGEDSQGRQIVKVLVDKQTEERVVVTGLSDGFDTEIISGLKEGEVVLRKLS